MPFVGHPRVNLEQEGAIIIQRSIPAVGNSRVKFRIGRSLLQRGMPFVGHPRVNLEQEGAIIIQRSIPAVGNSRVKFRIGRSHYNAALARIRI